MEMIEVVGHRRPYREGGHGGRRLLRDVDGCRGLARWLGSGPLLAAGPWFARRAGGVVEALFCPGVCGGAGSSLHHGLGGSEEHTSELQSRGQLVCRLLLEKEKERGTAG